MMLMISRAVDFDWQKLTMPFTDSLQYFCLSWFTLVVVAATQLDSVITKSASDICQAPICYLGEYCSQLLPKCANVKPGIKRQGWIEFTGKNFQGTPTYEGKFNLAESFEDNRCQVEVTARKHNAPNKINLNRCNKELHSYLFRIWHFRNKQNVIFQWSELKKKVSPSSEELTPPPPPRSANEAVEFTLNEVLAADTTKNSRPTTTRHLDSPANPSVIMQSTTSFSTKTIRTHLLRSLPSMTTEMAQGSSALKTFYTTTPTTLESGRQSGNDDSSHYQPPFVSIPEGQTEIKQYEKFVFTAYSGEMFDLPVPVNKSFRVEVERVSPRSVWLFGNDNGLSRIQGFSLFRSVGQYSFVLRALEDDSILGEGVLHIRLRDGDQACERNHYFITEQNVPMGLNDTISIIRSRVEPRVSADTANSHINDTVVVLRVQLNRDLHTVEWMSRLLLERGVTCRDVKHDELVAVYVELDEDQKHFTTFISDCRSWLRWFSQITVSLLVLLMVTIMILTCLWAFYRPVSALGTNSCDDSRCSS